MRYWLLKSEPDSFSWARQVEHGTEPWTGVRSHQAKRNLQAMALGDRGFFYHSSTGREIVGVVEVARIAYPDPTDASDAWVSVDMRAYGAFERPVSLAALKSDPAFAGMELLRLSRLSVVPVSAEHWTAIIRLGGWTQPRAV